MLLPVDDDGGDLLVHEEEDGEEQGGDGGQEVYVPGRIIIIQRDQPGTKVGSCWLLEK